MAVGLFLFANITRIQLEGQSGSIGGATGFLVKWNSNWFLISNWHVFSGRHPVTGQPSNGNGDVPQRLTFSSYWLEQDKLIARRFEVTLGDASIGEATWLQHPAEGQNVDIAALPVPSGAVGLAKDILGEQDANMHVDVGSEVFVPGFPRGICGPVDTAIWKRASIASSLDLGALDPTFYIDTASREGMSGAPCLAISTGPYLRRVDPIPKLELGGSLGWRILGVYAGRNIDPEDALASQLGRVWDARFLVDVLQSGVPGTVVIKPTKAQ